MEETFNGVKTFRTSHPMYSNFVQSLYSTEREIQSMNIITKKWNDFVEQSMNI